MKLNWNFLREGGCKTKILPWGNIPNIYILNNEDQSENEKSTDEETTEKEQVNPIPLPRQNPQVTAQAINIAHSLLDTCLSQLCKLYLMTDFIYLHHPF